MTTIKKYYFILKELSLNPRCKMTISVTLINCFCGGRDLNLEPCIFYIIHYPYQLVKLTGTINGITE